MAPSGSFEFLPLRGDSLGVYCMPGHPLAGRRKLSLQHCAQATWLLPPEGSPPHAAFLRWCEQQGLVPSLLRMSTRSVPLTIELVKTLGCLYVGLASLMDLVVGEGRLHRLPLAVPLEVDGLGLLRPRERRTRAVDEASQFLRRTFGQERGGAAG